MLMVSDPVFANMFSATLYSRELGGSSNNNA